ncbi:MAG: helix-turn-helix transcriptional regulator [Bacteroidetes bacterium]|nr:helix-turn-helix transcriptional regulator [Bacteroidota bacterium]
MEDKELLKKLGKRIVAIREGKNITQVELANLCEFDRSNMNRIESGNTNPTTLTIKIICESLDIPIKELFNFD